MDDRTPFSEQFMHEIARIARLIDTEAIERIAHELWSLRYRGGRLFVFGVGGSAATSSHAVNDFRKICKIDACTPVDNVSELTARINDDGWDCVFAAFLEASGADANDAALVFSVGGGNAEKNISTNIVLGLTEAKKRGMKIFGVVGRDGGYTKKVADAVVVVPMLKDSRVTAHTESFHAVILHCIVFHPSLLQDRLGKWESMGR